MPDILPLDHEDNHFRHVGGMIGNPFQTFRDMIELD